MSMSEEVFHKLINKEIDTKAALLFGKLKIEGSLGEANRFSSGFLRDYFGENSEFAKKERASNGRLMMLLI